MGRWGLCSCLPATNETYYDDLGQLIREDNRAGNYTLLIKYDEAGNILGKKYIDFTTYSTSQTPTTTYTYGNSQWGDLLTKIDGETITYDTIGNPTAIGSNTTLSWQGRQLMSVTNSYIDMVDVYTETTSYTYNSDGIRTSKNIDGVLHEYILDGALIVAEKWSDKLIVYLYDENSSPIGLKYRTSSYAEGVYDYYFFEKNIQGDVVAVYNSSGTKIGSYIYDAWGQIISTNVASGTTNLESKILTEYNPFRYRGYYYDVDTGWYYLQSRYYNPEWGRFINADSFVNANGDILGFNMFAYCGNNPVMGYDPTGHFVLLVSVIKFVVISLAVAGTVNDICQIASGNVTAEVTSSTEEGDAVDNVHISNSYKIVTPWMQYGYSFYLNYIDDETKSLIDGTVLGTTFEWGIHNIAYLGSTIMGMKEYSEMAQSVDIGKTLFSDSHGGIIEHGMKIPYIVLFPLSAITDMLIEGGYR